MRYFNTTFINQTVNNPTNSYTLFARRAIFVSCADFGFDGNYFILQCVVYVGSFGVGFTDFVCDEKSVFSQPDGAHRELYAGDDALGLYV